MSTRDRRLAPDEILSVPMLDLRSEYSLLEEEISAAVLEVLRSGSFVDGPEVDALEAEMAAFLDVPHAVACSSGTDALRLALMATGIGAGDEVITTAFTFIATASAIVETGATPVFVDVDPRSWTLDPEQVAAAIGPRTRAILPVHLYGQPADMNSLRALSRKHRLVLIEDSAQAFGASLRGELKHLAAGACGDFGCFSLYPSKNLGGYGNAGLVVTHSRDSAQRLRALRNHGSHQRYQHELLGINSRMDEIQAAVLRIKLRHLERANRERRNIAAQYTAQLAGSAVTTPSANVYGRHVYNQYTILCRRRDALMQCLQDRSIPCAIHYPRPLHQQPALQGSFAARALPVTERLASQCLSLPIYPQMPSPFIQAVTSAILDFSSRKPSMP